MLISHTKPEALAPCTIHVNDNVNLTCALFPFWVRHVVTLANTSESFPSLSPLTIHVRPACILLAAVSIRLKYCNGPNKDVVPSLVLHRLFEPTFAICMLSSCAWLSVYLCLQKGPCDCMRVPCPPVGCLVCVSFPKFSFILSNACHMYMIIVKYKKGYSSACLSEHMNRKRIPGHWCRHVECISCL